MDQSKYTSKLIGARILIIGGTSGLGFGVAEALLEHNASVIISSSNQEKVTDKVTKLKSLYPSATSRIAGYACSLSDAEKLESNILGLLEAVGKLDHIVFTAGDPVAVKPLANFTITEIVQAGMVRFFAPMIVAKHAPKYMSGGPRSSITLTTGAVSQRPLPDWVVVGAYATGLKGMTRSLALDLAPIRVNLVSPGPTDTEFWSLSGEEKQAKFESLAGQTRTGRVGRVEDIVESFLYLIKDENATGSTVSTSGGSLLNWFAQEASFVPT